MENKDRHINLVGLYNNFKGMSLEYLRANKEINKETMLILGMLQEDMAIGVLFIKYVVEYWKSYLMDIVEGKFEMVEITPIVYSCFLSKMLCKQVEKGNLAIGFPFFNALTLYPSDIYKGLAEFSLSRKMLFRYGVK